MQVYILFVLYSVLLLVLGYRIKGIKEEFSREKTLHSKEEMVLLNHAPKEQPVRFSTIPRYSG